VGVPSLLLGAVLADAAPFGEVDPGRGVRFLEVCLALFVFPFAAGERGAARAAVCAALGMPLLVLAERLADRTPLGLPAALPPLALLAAAALGRGARRGPWHLGAAAVCFGLPWLEYLGLDFGGGETVPLGVFSPALGGGPASSALLGATALAGWLAGRRRR
jgi:hypothetical protein